MDIIIVSLPFPVESTQDNIHQLMLDTHIH